MAQSNEQGDQRVGVPFSHALFVSVQSIRNRFGRNLITLAGIALGIAFLMSVFTGDTVSRCLKGYHARQQRLQAAVARITSDVGRLQGRPLAVVGRVPLDGLGPAVLARLVEKGAVLRLWPQQEVGVKLFPGVSAAKRDEQVAVSGSLGGACDGAEAILWVGGPTTSVTAQMIVDARDRLSERVVLDLSPLVRPDTPQAEAIAQLAQMKRKTPDGGTTVLFSVARVGEPDEAARRRQEQETHQARARTYWLVGVSILVSFIGIANAMLMSVYERFREIGTMKCLGAVNSFVVLIFLLESAFQGVVGAVAGVVVGSLFSVLAYAFSEGFARVFGSLDYGDVLFKAGVSIVFGAILGVGAAIGPARRAATMVPADALRTEI